ncbi:MAG: YdcF family protein [Methylothermaceae bacterium]|nr:YdcF family protein [Methylothermaceae bacterium]
MTLPGGYALLRTLETLVLPPGSLLLLAGLGLWLRRPMIVAIALLLFYLAAIPATTHWLYRQLEVYPALDPEHLPAAQAIVVLGASRYRDAPEYGGDTIAGLGLERLRYAAWLQRRTGLPILASGGRPLNEEIPEAALMQEVLTELGTPARWLETESRNTFENARKSTALLKNHNIDAAFVVTHVWHLPRAVEAFSRARLHAIPAGTHYSRPGPLESGLLALIPNPAALYHTGLALHEICGRWWYQIRYYGIQK